MAKLLAKCFYCNQQFDRNKEEWVAVNARRYAHKSCHEQAQAGKTQDEKDYEELVAYVKQKFGYTTVPAKISRQITDYKKAYNFTYSGMLKALKWWFDIKKNTLEGTNGGIGILPYIYNDARTYYYGLFVAQMVNENKDLEHYKTKVEIVEIAPPQVYVQPPRLFNIGEEDENE